MKIKKTSKEDITINKYGLIAIIVILIIVFTSLNSAPSTSNQSLSIGEQGFLYDIDGSIPAGISKLAMKDLDNTLNAGDLHGFEDLLNTNRITFITSGTRVLKLSDGSYSYEHIRVLEGPLEGEDVYVHYQSIRK